jgi:hypothetical protein
MAGSAFQIGMAIITPFSIYPAGNIKDQVLQGVSMAVNPLALLMAPGIEHANINAMR